VGTGKIPRLAAGGLSLGLAVGLKAAEGRRTPRRGRVGRTHGEREAAWSAPVLWRFGKDVAPDGAGNSGCGDSRKM